MIAMKKIGAAALLAGSSIAAFAQSTPAAGYQGLIDEATDKAPEFIAAVVAVGVVLIGLNLTLKAVKMVAAMFGGGSSR